MADLPFNPVQHQVPIQLTEDDDEGESDEELAPQPGVKPKTIQSRRKSHQKPEASGCGIHPTLPCRESSSDRFSHRFNAHLLCREPIR